MHKIVHNDIGIKPKFRGLVWKIQMKPHKYINMQPDLYNKIKLLKKKGKSIFLATNSSPPFMKAVVSHTFGDPKWQDYFDLVATDCKKPLF